MDRVETEDCAIAIGRYRGFAREEGT